MSNFTKSFLSDGAVGPYKFVKASATDGSVTLATGAGTLGATREVGAIDQQRLDVMLQGENYLTAGAAFPRFSELVADGNGNAIAAAPAAGHALASAAIALEPAVAAGDQVRVFIRPGCAVG